MPNFFENISACLDYSYRRYIEKNSNVEFECSKNYCMDMRHDIIYIYFMGISKYTETKCSTR